MKQIFLYILILFFTHTLFAAQKKKHWYKVETEPPKKQPKEKPSYIKDSLGADDTLPLKLSNTILWTLQPKLLLSGGFLFDKAVLEESASNRMLISGGLRFRNRPLSRISAQVKLLQNNSLLLSGSWDITSSRKAIRSYYGFGLAHRLVSEKKFANLVDLKNYYVTAHYGYDYLLKSRHGLFFEFKALLGTNDYGLLIQAGYIIPI